ncbi:hypothetical protein D3C72_1078420 [compost metagenome]
MQAKACLSNIATVHKIKDLLCTFYVGGPQLVELVPSDPFVIFKWCSTVSREGAFRSSQIRGEGFAYTSLVCLGHVADMSVKQPEQSSVMSYQAGHGLVGVAYRNQAVGEGQRERCG